MQNVNFNSELTEEEKQILRSKGYEDHEGMSSDIETESENSDQESDIEVENPIVKRILQENMQSLREGANFQQPTNYVEPVKQTDDLESKLAYTSFKESSNKPWKVNSSKPNAPTTGFFHIEQPTYIEQMAKIDPNEASRVRNLRPEEYVRYVQANKEKEREVAKKIIADKVAKHGEDIIIDNMGRPNPAWRVAYTMGDTGFKRYLKNTKQEAFNE